MRRTSRGLAGVIGLALAASAITPAAAAGHGQRHAVARVPGGGVPVRTATVTLVTGDVVHLSTYRDGRQVATASGASRGRFQTLERDGHSMVFPTAALPYVARGLLDKRLFDVTELVAQGYDDAHAKALPLILEYGPGLRAGVVPAAAQRERTLASIGSVAVTVPRAKLGQFWEGVDDDRRGIAAVTKPVLGGQLRKVWLDAKAKASLDVSVPQIGAPAAWAAGFDGAGTKVAVLDTGIDAHHPDVAGRIAETANFSADADVQDLHGHGTHVASTVAGNGAASGGKYKGVAPKAQLVIGKVLDHTGSGQTSDIVAGMEWAAARAKVVSMSLGGDPTDGTDPLSEAVNRLSAQYGALFVIAAGNYGDDNTVAAPGAADAALTVGAVTKADELAVFSSRGPRLGDRAVKPEIVAPGANIVAARAAGTWPDIPGDPNYVPLNGTSMATPHVAGAAILLAQQHPTWTGQQLKAALTSTAKAVGARTVYEQGAGRVDLTRAVAQNVSASTGTLSMGRFLGPYGNTEPARKTVTYRNDGDADVTFDLTVAAKSAGGAVAGPEMLSVTPASVTVPAHGTADATVSLDPDTGDLGLYSGRLIAAARDGKTALAAAVGFEKEFLHALNIKVTARDGRTTFGWGRAIVWNNTTGDWQFAWVDEHDVIKALVRPGEYTVMGYIPTFDEPGVREIDLTAYADPDVTVAGNVDMAFDARKAKSVVVRTPRPAEMMEASHSLYRKTAGHYVAMGGDAWNNLSVLGGGAAKSGEFEYYTRYLLDTPKLTMRIAGADVALHPRYLNPTWAVSPRLDGHRKLPAVFVGAGRPDDYAGRDVRGKVALVRQTPGLKIEDQVAAANAANAAFVGVLASGPGVFDPEISVPLPTIGFQQAEGADLLARLGRGKVLLDMTGVANSTYCFNILLPSKQVPDGIDYTVDGTNTAIEHARVHAVRPNERGWHATTAMRPYATLGWAGLYQRPFPYAEDRYFTVGDSLYGETFYSATGGNSDTIKGPLAPITQPGERTVNWYKGVLRSGVTPLERPVSRDGDKLLLTFANYVDAEPDHVSTQGAKAAARVYRDGELVAQGAGAAGSFDVGTAEPATYRVELDVAEPEAGWQVSNEIHTAWTFRSARTSASTPLPVLTANWDLDLDLANAAPAGRAFALRLNAGTQPGATPVAVAKAKVWASFDNGGTWKRVAVDGTGGHFVASVWHPKLANTSGYVALRYELTDAAGGKLEQTVMRAYALK